MFMSCIASSKAPTKGIIMDEKSTWIATWQIMDNVS